MAKDALGHGSEKRSEPSGRQQESARLSGGFTPSDVHNQPERVSKRADEQSAHAYSDMQRGLENRAGEHLTAAKMHEEAAAAQRDRGSPKEAPRHEAAALTHRGEYHQARAQHHARQAERAPDKEGRDAHQSARILHDLAANAARGGKLSPEHTAAAEATQKLAIAYDAAHFGTMVKPYLFE